MSKENLFHDNLNILQDQANHLQLSIDNRLSQWEGIGLNPAILNDPNKAIEAAKARLDLDEEIKRDYSELFVTDEEILFTKRLIKTSDYLAKLAFERNQVNQIKKYEIMGLYTKDEITQISRFENELKQLEDLPRTDPELQIAQLVIEELRPAQEKPVWFLSEEYVGRDKTLMVELPDGELFVTFGLVQANLLLRFLGGDNYQQSPEELARYIHGSDEPKRIRNVDSHLAHLRKALSEYDWTIALCTADIKRQGRSLQGLTKVKQTDAHQLLPEVVDQEVVEVRELVEVTLPDGSTTQVEDGSKLILMMALDELSRSKRLVLGSELIETGFSQRCTPEELDSLVVEMNQQLTKEDNNWRINKSSVGSQIYYGYEPVRPEPEKEAEPKVKISTLEQRDPEIKDRFKKYLAEIEAKNISTPIAPAALAKHVGRISTERVEKARENGYLKPAGDKRHYLLTIEDVLTLFYLTDPDCPWRNNFNRHISRDLRRLADGLVTEKNAQKKTNGNNHLRT